MHQHGCGAGGTRFQFLDQICQVCNQFRQLAQPAPRQQLVQNAITFLFLLLAAEKIYNQLLKSQRPRRGAIVCLCFCLKAHTSPGNFSTSPFCGKTLLTLCVESFPHLPNASKPISFRMPMRCSPHLEAGASVGGASRILCAAFLHPLGDGGWAT